MANQTTHGSNPVDLAAAAEILMNPTYYSDVLKAAERYSRSDFKDICDNAKIDENLVDELWAAAAGTQSTEALSRYPGSAGW